ncbi:cytochrome c [Sulfuricella denitrificans skB26]|uniref:Cytochrome c n=1 Tax=Sulfuricella denitrificans (strain DSM 22764 / NBRC 105220 / skB26) TaxID=1163617 RepID=S6AN92_SULDS|nr:c-type cytochrome [Sulfuricella denitrificans]BAN36304.1 cytochrome c [Sulfuricella denitrificans skB26]
MYRIFALTLLVLAGSLPAQAAPDGARLYARNCAACHGENGGGGLGVPLSLPSFQATVSNDYLHKTIRLGRPGRVMPTSALPDADIDAIVRHIRSWNKAPAPQFSATPVKGNAGRGRVLYAERCVACHGADGEGGKGTGVTFSRPRDLPIMAPALNNPGFLAAASDSMIKKTLMNGREGTPMVSFLKQGLKEKDIDDIVSFIRSFEKSPRSMHAGVLETEQAVLTMDSPYDLKTTIENVKQAASSNNFIFIREQPLNHGLTPTGQEDPHQHIIYFCNFSMLNAALATDPRVGLFLPCRITVVEQNGKVKMMTVNPKRLSKIFNNAELNTLCDEMTKHYLAIMEEAAI